MKQTVHSMWSLIVCTFTHTHSFVPFVHMHRKPSLQRSCFIQIIVLIRVTQLPSKFVHFSKHADGLLRVEWTDKSVMRTHDTVQFGRSTVPITS